MRLRRTNRDSDDADHFPRLLARDDRQPAHVLADHVNGRGGIERA
jgi:hypothetical protein